MDEQQQMIHNEISLGCTMTCPQFTEILSPPNKSQAKYQMTSDYKHQLTMDLNHCLSHGKSHSGTETQQGLPKKGAAFGTKTPPSQV